MLLDNWVEVRLAAIISPINGNEILPSGRTGTLVDNSGLRHTLICKASPTPIRYSSVTPRSEIGGAVTFLELLHAANTQAANTSPNHAIFFIDILREKSELVNALAQQDNFNSLNHD